MYCLKNILILLPFLLMAMGQMNNYGPYKLNWDNFSICKGLKRKECGNFELANTQNMSDVHFYFNLTKDCVVTNAKIISNQIKNNSTKKLVNYHSSSPCNHFAFGPILSKIVSSTTSCTISKEKHFNVVNMEQTTLLFLGQKFFYGTYTFKIMLYNNNENGLCVNGRLTILQK